MSRREGGQMQWNALLLRPPTVWSSPQPSRLQLPLCSSWDKGGKDTPHFEAPNSKQSNLISLLSCGGFPESLNQGGSRSCSQSPISGTFRFSILLAALSLRQRGLCFLKSNQVVTLEPFYHFLKLKIRCTANKSLGWLLLLLFVRVFLMIIFISSMKLVKWDARKSTSKETWKNIKGKK